MECLECRKQLERKDQKKFCSRSCAASHNNRKKPKREPTRASFVCKNCNKTVSSKDVAYRETEFCSGSCRNKWELESKLNAWLTGEHCGQRGRCGGILKFVRDYVLQQADHKCNKCGWGERNQFTGLVPLDVHHKDGNWKNNRPENLEVLCKNCHSLTKSYGSRNNGQGRPKFVKQ